MRKYDETDSNRKLYDYDLNEHIMQLTDWIHQPIVSKYTDFLHSGGDEDIDSILINGRGVYIENDEEEEKRKCKRRRTVNRLVVDNEDENELKEMPRSQFDVKAGSRYRFRAINSGTFYCPLEISIQNHTMTVIATDGHSTEPMEVASFILLLG